MRLRLIGLRFIAYPACGQEEQRHQSSIAYLRLSTILFRNEREFYLRIMVGARTRRGPTRALPALHSLQLRCLVKLNDAIDLAIRMFVVLSGVLLLRLHVHSGQGEISGLW